MLSESDTSSEDSAENVTNPPNYNLSTKDPGKIRILTVNCRATRKEYIFITSLKHINQIS